MNNPLLKTWNPDNGSYTMQDSLTVPGEAYTIQQLFDRAQSGVPMDVSVKVHPGIFAEDADFDTFAPEADFDLVDAENLARESSETINQAKEALKESKKKPPKDTGAPPQDEATINEVDSDSETKEPETG